MDSSKTEAAVKTRICMTDLRYPGWCLHTMSALRFVLISQILERNSLGNRLRLLEILGDRSVLRPIIAVRFNRNFQTLGLQCLLLLIREAFFTERDLGSREPRGVRIIVNKTSRL